MTEDKETKVKCLVACEESQRTTIEMRKLGIEAYSCDLIECSGGYPEYHIKGDCVPLLNGHCSFKTCDGHIHTISSRWDLIIAHPPCTYLTVSGNRWFDVTKYGQKAIKRIADRNDAVQFFMKFVNADCEYKAIENPIGYMNTHYRKPNQIIQPYQFGEPFTKSTCLWLFNLPNLKPTNILEKPVAGWNNTYIPKSGKMATRTFNTSGKILAWNNPETARLRSQTPYGVARAMADQWG